MTIKDEKIELEGTNYYRIIILLSEIKDKGNWFAQIRVLRRDTDEYINAGFTVYDNDKDVVMKSAIKRVSESLLPDLEKLGEPSDWNRESRYILLNCKKIHSKIVEFGEYTDETLSSGENVDKYWIDYTIFWKYVIKESIVLSKKIDALNDNEKVNLLVIPDNCLIDPSDAWSLDEIDMRIMVFDYFANPTDQENNVHELQKKRLSDRFNELGWH